MNRARAYPDDVDMAIKEGIPALAATSQSDTDAQTINIDASIGKTQSAMLGTMVAPMMSWELI